jgi:hypothetical protein
VKPTIFFDLDGVIADFVRGTLRAHGREDFPIADVRWGMEEQLGLSAADFWRPMGYDFWRNLGRYDDGLRLLRGAEKLIGPDRIAILTSAASNNGCIDAKRDWIAEHLPGYERRTFTGEAKFLFAERSKLLVDDRDENCDRFCRAGGRAVQPPRPWNRRRDLCGPDGSFDVEPVLVDIQAEIARMALWT